MGWADNIMLLRPWQSFWSWMIHAVLGIALKTLVSSKIWSWNFLGWISVKVRPHTLVRLEHVSVEKCFSWGIDAEMWARKYAELACLWCALPCSISVFVSPFIHSSQCDVPYKFIHTSNHICTYLLGMIHFYSNSMPSRLMIISTFTSVHLSIRA